MKVIGKVNTDTYLVEIQHTEIEKFLGLYYNNLKRLDVGQEVDLGKAYNYAADIKRAMDMTREFVASNKAVVNAIINGLRIEELASAADNQESL